MSLREIMESSRVIVEIQLALGLHVMPPKRNSQFTLLPLNIISAREGDHLLINRNAFQWSKYPRALVILTDERRLRNKARFDQACAYMTIFRLYRGVKDGKVGVIGFRGGFMICAGAAVNESGGEDSSRAKVPWSSVKKEEGEMVLGDSWRVDVGDTQVGPMPYDSIEVCRV